MNSLGIIANPASGKDIRRLVSHATVVDNNEKINIVKRIILGAQGYGVEKIFIMPDTFLIGYKVIEDLTVSGELKIPVSILNMKVEGNLNDTTNGAKIMEEEGVNCIVVLGGDGTNRAAAKAIVKTPLISVSTGTNNVYPEMLEGTVVGMTAAAITAKSCDLGVTCRKDKRIEIFLEDELIDIALVDCVISKQTFIGSKAIWDMGDIVEVIVSRAHPASIGFSTLIGVNMIIKEDDDFGAAMKMNTGEAKSIAPVAAGTLKEIFHHMPKKIELNEEYIFNPDYRGSIALDGEREIIFKAGDKFKFKITRNGPFRVNIKRTLEEAQKNGFFKY